MNGSTPATKFLKAPFECTDCLKTCKDDVYIWYEKDGSTSIVCGDCRYFRRHGHVAPHQPRGVSSSHEHETERGYHGGFGSHTVNRQQHYDVLTERGAEVLDEILSDSRLSLD